MFNIKRLLTIFIILIVSISCVSFVFAAENKIIINAAHSMPMSYHYQDGMVRFKEVVEELSGGEMEVNIYPAAQLGEERVTMEQLKLGALPIVLTGISDTYAPRTGVFILPFLFKSADYADKILNGPIGKEVYSDLLKNNMKVLSVWSNGFRQITNNRRPINSIDDMKGLKIRVPESPVWLATMKALGATATPMPFAEVSTSLAQGLIDGQENSLLHIKANKTYEQQKYLAVVSYMYGPAPLLANVNWFNSLTKKNQDIILKAAAEGNEYMREIEKQRNIEAIEFYKKEGIKISYPNLDNFREVVKPVYKQFESKFGADLIQNILDAQK